MACDGIVDDKDLASEIIVAVVTDSIQQEFLNVEPNAIWLVSGIRSYYIMFLYITPLTLLFCAVGLRKNKK